MTAAQLDLKYPILPSGFRQDWIRLLTWCPQGTVSPSLSLGSTSLCFGFPGSLNPRLILWIPELSGGSCLLCLSILVDQALLLLPTCYHTTLRALRSIQFPKSKIWKSSQTSPLVPISNRSQSQAIFTPSVSLELVFLLHGHCHCALSCSVIPVMEEENFFLISLCFAPYKPFSVPGVIY